MADKNKNRRFADKELAAFHQEFMEHIEEEEVRAKRDTAERRMLREALEANTLAVTKVTKSTAGLVEAWDNAHGFLSVIVSISKWVKILAPIFVATGFVIYFLKTGTFHKSPTP